MFWYLWPVEKDVTENNRDKTEDAADYDGDVDQSCLLGAEVVHVLKYVRHGGKETEQRSEFAGDVEACEGDDRFGEEHVDRAEEGDGEKYLDLGCGGR